MATSYHKNFVFQWFVVAVIIYFIFCLFLGYSVGQTTCIIDVRNIRELLNIDCYTIAGICSTGYVVTYVPLCTALLVFFYFIFVLRGKLAIYQNRLRRTLDNLGSTVPTEIVQFSLSKQVNPQMEKVHLLVVFLVHGMAIQLELIIFRMKISPIVLAS